MQKFKLQSNEPYRKKSKVVVIHAGVIEFDHEGVAEVEVHSEEHFGDILNSLPDAFAHAPEEPKGDPIKPQTDEDEIGKSGDDENDLGGADDENAFTGESEVVITGANESGSTETTTPDNEATEESNSLESDTVDGTLQNLKLAELKQLAADSGFPEAEWIELKKKELQAYLLSKLQPQA